jgi:hypothetical protein
MSPRGVLGLWATTVASAGWVLAFCVFVAGPRELLWLSIVGAALILTASRLVALGQIAPGMLAAGMLSLVLSALNAPVVVVASSLSLLAEFDSALLYDLYTSVQFLAWGLPGQGLLFLVEAAGAAVGERRLLLVGLSAGMHAGHLLSCSLLWAWMCFFGDDLGELWPALLVAPPLCALLTALGYGVGALCQGIRERIRTAPRSSG